MYSGYAEYEKKTSHENSIVILHPQHAVALAEK